MRKQAIAVVALMLLMACAPQGGPAPAPAKPAAPSAPAAPAAPVAPAAPAASQASAPVANPAGPIDVKYAYAPRLPMIPVFVAQEKGFFDEQGLAVDFVPFAGGSNEMLAPL